jgi:hypothetical protein
MGTIERDPVHQVYGWWERRLNEISAAFGGDRELTELSRRLDAVKERAYSGDHLGPQELAGVYEEMNLVARAYAQIAQARGFPLGADLPASKESFKVYQEYQEIHFRTFAGEDLCGGELGKLLTALGARDDKAVRGSSQKLAYDLIASASKDVAIDKVRLLRAELSRLDDRQLQRDTISQIGDLLETALAGWRYVGERQLPISRATFDAAARFEGTVAVHTTPLPDQVRGTNKLFPNRPVPGWEAVTRAATKACLDDLAKAGKLFLDRIPAGHADTKTVAMKLDLNLGADGPPSVSDPTTTQATILELLERAGREGKHLRFVVGDSSGGENIPLGRLSMDILRDTGNYHHALKAGLSFAVARGGHRDAQAALQKIEAAEARGVFFGSKDDALSTPADLAFAEQAAREYVKVVDFDAEGYTKVDPKLGPIGLAAWGSREFRMSKPWVEADFRVHVARGVSTHLLAGWTGSLKGLIGLHGFGRRPVDRGMAERGDSMTAVLPALTQVGGFMAVFSRRAALPHFVEKVSALGDPELSKGLAELEARWKQLQQTVGAWGIFEKGTLLLADELKADEAAGMDGVELAAKMRSRTRAVLDQADRAAPGFRQGLFDAIHAGTRFALVAAARFRNLIPPEIRDEAVGNRIGLLTVPAYRSDLVVQAQPKLGEIGGPDAYGKVSDVGIIVAGTDEASVDVTSWERSGLRENIFRVNHPVHAALRYAHGPMSQDEVKDVS